jgi:hypothetical protein
MSLPMETRARAWASRESPSADELLRAHNALVYRVRKGQEAHAEVEGTLEFLGESFVEAGGDPVLLLDVDAAEPVTCSTPAPCLMSADSYALVDYDSGTEARALQGEEKALAFEMLRKQLGVSHVASR